MYVGLVWGGVVLVVALLAVLSFARTVLTAAGETRVSLTLATGVALMISVSALLTRLTQDLVLATVLTGTLAFAGTLAAANVGRDREDLSPGRKIPWIWRALTVGLVVGATWATLDGHWWDEDSCHFGLVTVLARGIVPPQHPLFPGEPFRYHYGFDLLAAQVRAFTGANAARAIDVATLISLGLLLAVAKDAGAALAGAGGTEDEETGRSHRAAVAAGLAMVLVPLGSGALQILLFRDVGPLEVRWSAVPQAWGDAAPPPVISNFFQHPQGLGMSLALAVLLLFSGADDNTRRARVVIGSVLLGALALVQIVFFGVLGLALGTAMAVRALRSRARGRFAELALDGACLLGALALARLLGGFLEPGPSTGEMLKFGQSLFSDPLGVGVLHYLLLFGVPLVVLPFALAATLQNPSVFRVSLSCAALIGFLVPNFVTYERSWDIVKFFGIGAFFANLLLAERLAVWLEKRSPFRRAFIAVLVVLSTSTGWIWLARMSVLNGRLGVPAMHFPPPSELGRLVGERLEGSIQNDTRVFNTNVDLARASGILTPGFDWRWVGQGFLLDREKADRLNVHKERARRDLDTADLEALGVTWLVLSPGDLAALSPRGKGALADPTRFHKETEVEHKGDRRVIYRVISDSPDAR